MNAKTLIAAVAVCVVAGTVSAEQTYPYVDSTGFKSTKTRAEVIDELARSKADGSYERLHQEFWGQYPNQRKYRDAGSSGNGNTSTPADDAKDKQVKPN